MKEFAPDVNAHTEDPSYRCFHIDITPFVTSNATKPDNLWIRLIASSGTKLVAYYGHGSERVTQEGMPNLQDGKWDAVIDLTEHLSNKIDGKGVNLFYPLTTTFVEIKLNREPMPAGNVEAEILTLQTQRA